MAADWIKIRSNLGTDPDVVAMAAQLAVDEFAVVGRLHALWAWADQHSEDGNLPRATSAFVDRLTACPGFAEALRGVGWLDGRDSALRLPNWDRHNGSSAKSRAVEARKKQRQRDKCPDDRPEAVPVESGPEKRREEKSKKTPIAPTPNGNGEHEPSLPLGGKGITEGAASKLLPTTPQSKRIAIIFHRKLTTPWTEKEVRAYRKLGTLEEDDLASVEAYYAAQWPPNRDVNILRHDLLTFLNNFPGEVGRAKAWRDVSEGPRKDGFRDV